MGYDSYECLVCYLWGCNEICRDDSGYLCLLCVHKYRKEITSRVLSALKEFGLDSDTTCDLCGKKGVIAYYVPMCPCHKKKIEDKEIKEDSESESD